jgi:hypothetical protein
MRPIDNAYTYQGSQRAKEKCQQLMGELPSPLLRRRRLSIRRMGGLWNFCPRNRSKSECGRKAIDGSQLATIQSIF